MHPKFPMQVNGTTRLVVVYNIHGVLVSSYVPHDDIYIYTSMDRYMERQLVETSTMRHSPSRSKNLSVRRDWYRTTFSARAACESPRPTWE